jgi:MFS family permease
LIALNLSILTLTGSAAAVAGLYIIRPVALLLTNMWSGSVIDRMNKRKLMIIVNTVRGLLILLIPIANELWVIYLILLIINMVGAFFGPCSNVYITKLVPPELRKRFNSIMSMTNSGAFLLGPAIAGVLIMYVGTDFCILINAITFLICASIILLLPDVEGAHEREEDVRPNKTWQTLTNDWKIVLSFCLKAKYFIIVYFVFQLSMLIGFALDSQEVTYIKQHLRLTDRDYGLIVSIAGAGALAGGFVSAIYAKRVSLNLYLGVGMLITAVGYVCFYSSSTFLVAMLAFVILGFFMAFANAGYTTFFQNQVPINIMGRFASLSDLFQGLVQIGFTLLLGFLAELFPLQMVCIVFSVMAILLAIVLFAIVLAPNKAKFFNEETKMINS